MAWTTPRTWTDGEVVTAALLNAHIRDNLDSVGAAARGLEGRRYAMALGVIRNAGSGGGYWQPISDANHRPTFIDSVSTDTSAITITHSELAATKVAALIAVPDETLTAAGFTAGVSVGLTSSLITLRRQGRQLADYIEYNGSAWTSASGMFTPTFASECLHLVHPTLPVPDAFAMSVCPRGATYACTINGLSTTYLDIEFRDWAGTRATTANTNMKVYVTRGGHNETSNPQAVDTTAYPGSNIWIMGVFETA